MKKEQKDNAQTAQEELDNQKDKYGRKTVMTPSVLVKLEQAFALGCSDLEACYYAGIGKSTLYDYQKMYPEFSERKEELKSKPVLMARQTVLKGIAGHELKDKEGNVVKVINAPDPRLAMYYLKLKQHNEFKQGLDVDNSTVSDKVAEMETMMLRFVECRQDDGSNSKQPIDSSKPTHSEDNN